MSDEKAKCTRSWHDAFGENYDDCTQCFIRDGGMLGEPNPLLMTPEPYTDEQIKAMWDEEMIKRKDSSPAFKALMSWMFDFEEYKEVMKLAHLPNPHLRLSRGGK